MDENQIYYLGRVEKNTIVLKQNSNRLTDVTKLLETPTEFMSNVSDSDHTLCLRNGKTVTFVINVKILKPLQHLQLI